MIKVHSDYQYSGTCLDILHMQNAVRNNNNGEEIKSYITSIRDFINKLEGNA